MRAFNLIAIAFLFSSSLFATVPSGFDDPGLIAKLKKGDIVQKEITSTAKEIKVLYRAFFKGITAEDYAKKLEQHDDYKTFMSDVKDSKRLNTYATGRKYEYTITMESATPIGNRTFEPIFDQDIQVATNPDDESFVTDMVTNYTSDLRSAGFDTRLVPYDGGLLLAHTVHMHLKKYVFIGSAKKDFRDGCLGMIEDLRTELKATP